MQRLLLVLVSCFFLALAFPADAQNFKFRQFSLEDGISQPFIYGLVQDETGYLWVGTGEGLCRYNGFRFETFLEEDSIAESFISATFKDEDNTLWFGHKQGSISFYEDGRFHILDTREQLNSTINAIASDNEGNIWFASQSDGLMRVDEYNRVQHYKARFKDFLLYSLAFTPEGLMLVGTDQGMFIYKISEQNEQPELVRQAEEIPMTKIQCIVPSLEYDNYWVGTEDAGLHKLHLSSTAPYRSESENFGETFGFPEENIQSVLEDGKGNIWAGTFGSGLYKVSRSAVTGQYEGVLNFNENNGLSNNYVKCLYEDREGNLWLGTYGGGVSNLVDDFFEFYHYDEQGAGASVGAVLVDARDKWFGLPKGLLRIEDYSERRHMLYNSENGFVDDQVTALFKDAAGMLWIGTQSNGIFKMDPSTEGFLHYPLSKDKLSNSIKGITSDGHNIWAATSFGVFTLNPESENIFHFTIENGLKHNNIDVIFQDSKENIWVGTHSNYISIINGMQMVNYQISNSSDIFEVTCMTEDYNGDIWIGTSGKGIYKFSAATFTNYSTKNGLYSNYCYSIIADKGNNIWVGHRGGLSRVETQTQAIRAYDRNTGIVSDCNFNAIWKDDQENVWIGTDQGTIKYDPARDQKNQVPPNTDILSVQVFDDVMAPDSVINLPYDVYKIRFDFIGLSFNNSEKVSYTYKLEGFDLGWSDPTTVNSFVYSRLEDGKYTFLVKACNSDGVCNESPTSIQVIIAKPIWKKWWFLLLISVSVVYAIYLYVRMRVRRHEKMQEYLQTELDARTKEVTEKNQELRSKNKDITDSINYAKRIQQAIMPDQQKLGQILPGAFIFFRPRDIVSGDFYWYHQFGDKVLVACADSTGHGVPGAFMSMIGSTILQDTIRHSNISSPKEILYALDREITAMLSKGTEEETRDGMDVSVCLFDLSTRKITIASAMRPLFICRNGEIEYIKANRHPIGGGLFGREKSFEETEMQLKEGDAVYLFSDGFPDQFGGAAAKKLKVSGMQEMIESFKGKPMVEQGELLAEQFDAWRDGHYQIDDVLVIGVQV